MHSHNISSVYAMWDVLNQTQLGVALNYIIQSTKNTPLKEVTYYYCERQAIPVTGSAGTQGL
jgi:hypothetical protein